MRADGRIKRMDMCAGARSWARKGVGRPQEEDKDEQRSSAGERAGARRDCVSGGKATEEDARRW